MKLKYYINGKQNPVFLKQNTFIVNETFYGFFVQLQNQDLGIGRNPSVRYGRLILWQYSWLKWELYRIWLTNLSPWSNRKLVVLSTYFRKHNIKSSSFELLTGTGLTPHRTYCSFFLKLFRHENMISKKKGNVWCQGMLKQFWGLGEGVNCDKYS